MVNLGWGGAEGRECLFVTTAKPVILSTTNTSIDNSFENEALGDAILGDSSGKSGDKKGEESNQRSETL